MAEIDISTAPQMKDPQIRKSGIVSFGFELLLGLAVGVLGGALQSIVLATRWHTASSSARSSASSSAPSLPDVLPAPVRD